MIDSFVAKISTVLVSKFPEELPPIGITKYGIKFLISNVIPIILLLLLGIWMNVFEETAVCIISFSSLRMLSGGFHSKQPEICIIFSAIMILAIAKFGYLVDEYKFYLNIASILLVSVFAPSNIENQTKILAKNFKYLKIASLLIVLIGSLMNNYLISASIFAQSLLLIRMKGGEKK